MGDTDNQTIELNNKMAKGKPISAPKKKQTGLETLLNDPNAEWEFTASGGTGALMVKSNTASSGGAAIKIEKSAESSKAPSKLSDLMTDFFQHAKGESPFIAPRMQVLNAKDHTQSSQLLKGKLETAGKPFAEELRFKDAQERLQHTTETTLVSMELAPGKVMSDLSGSEKVALYQSEHFAKALGRALPTMGAFGLSDHLGVNTAGSFSNATNLMFDTETGKISVIDYDATGDGKRVEGQGRLVMNKLLPILEKAGRSPEGFQEVVEQMAAGEGPLGGLMTTFSMGNGDEGEFFTSGKKQHNPEAENLRLEDVRRFAGNLLTGLVEGVEYLQTNQEALKNAVKKTHEQVEGETVEQFYTEQEMKQFLEQVNSVKVETLKAKVGQYASELPKLRLDQLRLDVEDLSLEISQKKDQLSKLEKKLFTNKEQTQLKKELQELGKKLEAAEGDLEVAVDRDSLANKMKKAQGLEVEGEEVHPIELHAEVFPEMASQELDENDLLEVDREEVGTLDQEDLALAELGLERNEVEHVQVPQVPQVQHVEMEVEQVEQSPRKQSVKEALKQEKVKLGAGLKRHGWDAPPQDVPKQKPAKLKNK